MRVAGRTSLACMGSIASAPCSVLCYQPERQSSEAETSAAAAGTLLGNHREVVLEGSTGGRRTEDSILDMYIAAADLPSVEVARCCGIVEELAVMVGMQAEEVLHLRVAAVAHPATLCLRHHD